MHPNDGKALAKGSKVRIPAGFRRGERTGGVVEKIISQYPGGEPEFVQVRWPKGYVKKEYILDIEFDTSHERSLWERLSLWRSKR